MTHRYCNNAREFHRQAYYPMHGTLESVFDALATQAQHEYWDGKTLPLSAVMAQIELGECEEERYMIDESQVVRQETILAAESSSMLDADTKGGDA